MKIRQISLTNFKRFTDTTVGEIPAEARLVLLMGPNGSGKSSLIEGVHYWHRNNWSELGGLWDFTYYPKDGVGDANHRQNLVNVTFHDPQPASREDRQKAVYVRTAYRNESEFQLEQLGRVPSVLTEARVHRLIDNDLVVSANYRRLVSEGLEYVYDQGAPESTLHEFRERAIGDIRDSMLRLFPSLILNSIGNPLENGTFLFDKGESKRFRYKNLSGGEKAAFDLLLDLHVKRREYNDTVFFVDEPEAHMSIALQANLLSELYRSVPENSQLWIGTHSLGMMRRARELSRANPGTVVFLDFDGANFDVKQDIEPVTPDRAFWKRAMQVAVDDMAGFISPERVVLCEGETNAGGSGFDAGCYNTIFATEFPESLFLGAGNADDIQNDPRRVSSMIGALSPGTNVLRIIDRDDRSDDEVVELHKRGVRVLSLRNIESYLLADDVLDAVCHRMGHPEAVAELRQAKSDALANSVRAGGPNDDLKRIAGDVHNAAKRLFHGKKLGSNARSFMSGVCAPEIKQGIATYEKLKADIFGA